VNYGIAGNPFTAFDTGGFEGQTTPLLLARWYGVAALSPIMRIHSRINWVPHFPFAELWGAEAAAAMKTFLLLRYALVPHVYSLAHAAAVTGLSPARPMRLEFPADASVAGLTSEWMFGDSLLVAPVLNEGNTSAPVLPALASGVWFEWNSSTTHAGGQTLQLADVPLSVVPAYARSGAIFCLAPTIQYTDALPGGPLDVVVYAGADGAFDLVDDDGETVGAPTMTVHFAWSDAATCLTWTRAGPWAGGPRSFTALRVTAFTTDGRVLASVPEAIGEDGRACLV
jgi:alpha-glucosidase